VESRQSIQVVGICALATHEHTSNAGLMRLGVGHCFRHDCIVLLQTIGDTRHSCHQYSVTQPCIAGFVDRNLFMFTGGHVLQSRRPPPPVSSVTRWKRRWSWCESVANSHVLRTPLANSNRFVAHVREMLFCMKDASTSRQFGRSLCRHVEDNGIRRERKQMDTIAPDGARHGF
jgi:hypothetical protein